MSQVRAVVLERDKRAVLRDWARLGTVQLVPRPAGLDTGPLASQDVSAQLSQCNRLEERMDELRRTLALPAPARLPGEPEELSLEKAGEQLGILENQTRELLTKRGQLLSRSHELNALREQVSAYCGLELPLDEPGHFEFLHFVTGSLPVGHWERLPPREKILLLPLAPVHERQPVIAMTTRRGRLALEALLAQAGFEPEKLPAEADATADTLAEHSRREQDSISKELQQAELQFTGLAADAAALLARLQRRVRLERCLLEAEQNIPRTQSAVLLSGWVPAAGVPALQQRLQGLTQHHCAIQVAPPEDVPEEQVPVLLRHSWLLRPFEMLVEAYGLPKYRELEPTIFVAISFVLMFGIMFGDVGQGALLALAGLGLRLAGRRAKLRGAGLVLLWAGLSSIGFGALYGSYFGLPQLKGHALWRDPLEGDPLFLLYGSVAVGVCMLSLGLLLNIVNCFRRREFLRGLLDPFGVLGALFYWGILALTIRHEDFASRGLVNPALVLFLAIPVTGWTLRGPIEHVRHRQGCGPGKQAGGWIAAGVESLIEAFEAVLSYLANTISFVRLAAYALSHAALLAATFMLAAEVQRASAAGSVLVIILGNLVAIVLEGVIASVQALRLEYYEFFSKFFSGAGQAFKPFQLTI